MGNLSRSIDCLVAGLATVAGTASAALAGPIFFVLLSGAGADAQILHTAEGTAPSFEVATIKENHTAGATFSFSLQSGRFMADAAPLDRLIRFAYDMKSDHQVVNMPRWADSERFDIDAKIGDADVEAVKKLPPDQRFQQYRLMVRSLLADRFQMKARTETQELPVYALVVAKNGPKLTPAAPSPETQKLQMPQLIFHASGDLKASSVSMAFFAGWLSGRPDTSDRVVIDTTGLNGSYDFALKWTPVELGSPPGGADANQQPGTPPLTDTGPSLFTAIQEQLGLKLEPEKGPVPVLVIDHIEQPSPN